MTDYELISKQIKALASASSHYLPLLSNASALLAQSMENLNWAGFYLMKNGSLMLGPFQGKSACVIIPVGKGVCGSAVKENKTLVIDDVHKFPGHIACDCASNSEIVIPLHTPNGNIWGVLDIDSPVFSRFTEHDRLGLESFVASLLEVVDYTSLGDL